MITAHRERRNADRHNPFLVIWWNERTDEVRGVEGELAESQMKVIE